MKPAPARLAVIIPAHNEAAFIEACLTSVFVACELLAERVASVKTIVVCDACIDDTHSKALTLGASVLIVNERNVGAARASGAAAAIAWGADWLSFTDADTVVSATWLTAQLDLGAEAVCGTVSVADWGAYGAHMEAHFATTYRDVEDHRHIHGANIGLSAVAYRRAGGFKPFHSSEDVALVEALVAVGVVIAWSCAPRVVTSARSTYRAPGGFGATLERVAAGFVSMTAHKRVEH